MGTSMILSLFTIFYLADVTLDTTIGELLINMQIGVFLPIAYSIVLSYLFLERLVILHILAFEQINKLIFKFWQKLDMYWFKKYKKHSPLTEGMVKIQEKVGKFQKTKSKKQRRVIIIAVIFALILVQVGFRAPIIIDYFEEEQPVLTPEEISQGIAEENFQEQEERIKVNIGR